MPKIEHRIAEKLLIFFRKPDDGIARVAKQAPYAARPMIVVDAKVMEKNALVRRAFCRNALAPLFQTDGTAAVLFF